MKNTAHLTQEVMVQSIDGELASSEQAAAEIHLANCEQCLNRYESLADLSEQLRHVVETAPVSAPIQARDRLLASIEESEDAALARPPILWKWAAAAAGLAIAGLLIVQQMPHRGPGPQGPAVSSNHAETPVVSSNRAQRHQTPVRSDASSFLSDSLPSAASRAAVTRKTSRAPRRLKAGLSPVEGQFIRLPYSDPSLPIQPSDVIHVEIRLSSLANAGIIRTLPVGSDPLVRADVLLGMDGQPSAIRLVQMTSPPR